MKERKTNFVYMEYLRVLCAFMVILIHVSGANWFRIEIGSADWIIQTFFNLAGRFSVCVFCMISGALFLRPDKSVTLHDIFRKYIRRILICFLTWTVFYAAFYTYLNSGDLKYFILQIFKISKHLWYLLMMLGLYLALPVIKVIAKDRDTTRYMIWLLLIFAAVFGTVEGVTGFFKMMAAENYGYSLWTAFLSDLDNLNMTFVPGYLGFFLMGHYIHEYGLGRWHKPLVYGAVPALLSVPLNSLLVFALSLAIAVILKKIPLIRNTVS